MLHVYLKALRDGAKLTQEDLGERLGFGETTRQSTVSNIECRRTAVSSEILARWLDAVKATRDQRLEALRLAANTAPDADEPVADVA